MRSMTETCTPPYICVVQLASLAGKSEGPNEIKCTDAFHSASTIYCIIVRKIPRCSRCWPIDMNVHSDSIAGSRLWVELKHGDRGQTSFTWSDADDR
jgi:hypothetical protein